MNVNSVSINNYSNTNSLNFTGRLRRNPIGITPQLENVIVENGISLKSVKLVKKLSHLIEEDWAKIRKSGNSMETPKYLLAERDGTLVTMKPMYERFKKSIIMEIEGDKYIDRITINRQKPSDYIYERATITPYGSASGRVYKSTIDKDHKIESRVNSYIDRYITNLFRRDDIKLQGIYD